MSRSFPTPSARPARTPRGIDIFRRPPWSKPVAFLLALATDLAVGAGDLLTGVETPFTLLYMVPIGFGVWFGPRRSGAFLAVVATACSLATDILASRRGEHAMPMSTMVWNAVGELGTFLLLCWLLAALQRRVAREEQERRLAVEQLRHADRLNTIGKLAAGIAHELGTPLNVLSGRAELIVAGRVVGEQAVASAQVVVDQAERMAVIIRQLLDFGRRSPDRRENRRSADLRTLLDEAASLLRPMAEKRGVHIVVPEASQSVMARVNAGEIQQVATNLMMNAVQAMGGGGTVTAEVQAGVGTVGFRVRDEGCGIPPEHLAHVFDPFFTTKDVGEGTGLGLSVTYGIVNDHGGRIDVESDPGKGSVFTVTLPA